MRRAYLTSCTCINEKGQKKDFSLIGNSSLSKKGADDETVDSVYQGYNEVGLI